MFRLVILVCALGVVAAAPPPQARSPKEVEDFRRFLLKAKPNNDSLEDAMARNPKASPWENSGKFQGDIVLNDEQIEAMVSEYAGTSRNALRRPGGLWPNRVIIWDFAPGHFTADQQNQVIAAFNMFHTRTCVSFRRRTNENTYVLVTGHQDGCYATVGHWQNFVHTFNLARDCFNHFIIIHEWLHIVGFWHMHQTYSRDNYIWINWQNMASGTEYNFDKFSTSEVDMLWLPYEYASNQHYGPFAFSNNGRPTIVAKYDTGGLMGQLHFVSAWDILRVNRLYGCPGAWDTMRKEDVRKFAYYGPESEQVMEQEQPLEEVQPFEQEPSFDQETQFEQKQPLETNNEIYQ